MLRRNFDYIRRFPSASGDATQSKGKRGRSGSRARKFFEAVTPFSPLKRGARPSYSAAAPATTPSLATATPGAAEAAASIEAKLNAFEVLWPHHKGATNLTLARARNEKGSHATFQAVNITLDKESHASPTSSDNTATEDSSNTTEADGCGDEGDDTCRDAAMAAAPAAARLAGLDTVAAQLASESRDASWQSAQSTRTCSSDNSTGRRRKKPPQGLPPSCLVDVPSMCPPPPPPAAAVDRQPPHLQSWRSPLFGRRSSRSHRSSTVSADEHALDTQRRAEWVQDSALAV